MTSALGFSEADAQCKRGGFSLLVLGHSIPPNHQKTLISHFRANCSAPIVSLLGVDGQRVDGADYHVSSAHPIELLQAILAILPVWRERGERPAICSDDSVGATLAEGNPYLLFGDRTWIRELLVSAIFASAADFGNVQLFDRSHRALRIVAQHGFGSEFLRHFEMVHEDGSACGLAMQRQSRVVVMDVASDPLFQNNGSREALSQAKVRSVQSTPLIDSSGRFIGVLSTHYERPNNPPPGALERLDHVIANFTANFVVRRQPHHRFQKEPRQLKKRHS